MVLVLAACSQPSGQIKAFKLTTLDGGAGQKATWAPTSDKLALRDRNKIRVFDVSDYARPRGVKTFRVPNLAAVSWSPDGRSILVEIETWDPRQRLYSRRAELMNVETWRRKRLAISGRDFFWVNKAVIAYFDGRSGGSTTDLFSYDLKNGREKPVRRQFPDVERRQVLKGRFLLGVNMQSTLSRDIVMIDLKNGAKRVIGRDTESISVSDSGRSVVQLRPRYRKAGGPGPEMQFTSPVHSANLVGTKLKVGKQLRIVDNQGRRLSVSNTCISPNGKLLAFVKVTTEDGSDDTEDFGVFLAALP